MNHSAVSPLWNTPEFVDYAPAPRPTPLKKGDAVSVYMCGKWVEGSVVHPKWRDHDATGKEYRGVVVFYRDGVFVNRAGRSVPRFRKALVDPFRVLKAKATDAAEAASVA